MPLFQKLSALPAAIIAAAAIAPTSAQEPHGDEKPVPQPELHELRDAVYGRHFLSVAEVVGSTAAGIRTMRGSGFFVGARGQLVTALPTPTSGELRFSVNYGTESMRHFDAELLAADPYTGLALLAVPEIGDVPTIPLPEGPSPLAPGDFIYSVAEPADGANACTPGRVAGKEKALDGETLGASVWRLHIDAPPEAVGAPLIAEDMRLAGVLLLSESDRVGYALPVEHVGKLLRDYRLHGRSRPAWLGLGMTLGTSTPVVRSLREGGPAAAAGLNEGDVILSIGGRPIDDYQDVIDTCSSLTAGLPVDFHVLRGLDDLTLSVTPSARED